METQGKYEYILTLITGFKVVGFMPEEARQMTKEEIAEAKIASKKKKKKKAEERDERNAERERD